MNTSQSCRTLCLLTFSAFIITTNCQDGSIKSEKIVGYGREASLGNLYNSNTNTFSPADVNIFDNFQIPPSAVHSFQDRFNWSRFSIIEERGDVLKNFHERGDAIEDILTINVTSRGKYLNITKSPMSVVGVVTFAYGTFHDILQLSQLDKLVRYSEHMAAQYTDVVMGIQYGGAVCIKFERAVLEEEDYENIKFHLKLQMYYLTAKPESSPVLFKKYFRDYPDAPVFNIEVMGDVPFESVDSVTVLDVLEFLNHVDESLSKNNGKGQSFAFDIMPLDFIRKLATSTKILDQKVVQPKTWSSEL